MKKEEFNKWSEYQEYVENGKFSIEDQCGELMLYSYFDTLQWGFRYAIVLKDDIIQISETYPDDTWYGAKSVYTLLEVNKPERKYSIGDKVVIRRDLVEGNYGSTTVEDHMLKYRGKVALIKEYDSSVSDGYFLDIDDCFWTWTEAMFE